MSLSLLDFLEKMAQSPPLALTVGLTLAVMLVNGCTDAPNAIAGVVVTGALSFRRAVLLAAVCNFLGVFCVTAVNASVAETVYSIASFRSSGALPALCAAMTAIVLWAAAAWVFGIPTSESHALVAGLTGAAVALEGGFSCVRWEAWAQVGAGLVLSTAAGLWAGRLVKKLLRPVRAQEWCFQIAQIPGAALTAFLHGAQDGQKFIGVFLLGAALAQGRQDESTFVIPLWLSVVCAGFMALGTLLGGERIIQKVGREMVRLTPRQGFEADLAGAACLLAATVLGWPASTTHTLTAALLGTGSCPDRRAVRDIVLAWGLTFPGCFLIGYALVKLIPG